MRWRLAELKLCKENVGVFNRMMIMMMLVMMIILIIYSD